MSSKQKRSGYRFLMHSSVFFSILLFVLVLVVGGAIFMLSMRQTIKTNKDNELIRLLENERMKLEISVNDKINTVQKMATSQFIRRYFANPDSKELEIRAFEEFEEYRQNLLGSPIFWVNDLDRKLYLNDKYVYTVDPSRQSEYWYDITLYKTERFNLNINHNPTLNSTMLWINAPVFNVKRLPIGMLGTGIEILEFIDAIYKGHSGNMEVYFFNGYGEITAAKNAALVTSKNGIEEKFGRTGKEFMYVARHIKSGEIKTFATDIGEVGMCLIPAIDWYVVAIASSSINDYKTSMTWLFLSMLLTMGVILAAYNFFVGYLFKPLRNTMSALEAALKVKDDFLAKMSHEIRTPMNAITGMAELALRENVSPPTAREHIYTIKQASANLLSIINDILDLSKIGSGKLEIIPTEYHFGSLINDVISIIRMRVVETDVRFVVNTDCKIPDALFGDEVRVRQILLNILSNAVKYTRSGSVSLAISGKVVDDNDTVILTIDVADTGKGIKQEDIGKLFGNFVQVDVESNIGMEGTGLGLVITKNLVTAMGGKISVMSDYGKGSAFTITLPQKIYSNTHLAAVDNPQEKSVIICDRRDIYANSMVCAIDNLGVRCTSVQNFDGLRDELKVKDYPFIFIEDALYEDKKGVLPQLNSKAKIVSVTSFGRVVSDMDLRVITMPAYSITVANILNGVSDGFSYHTDENTVVRFNAPEARVLVVDDVRTNLEVTKGLLTPYDMRVDVCLSGAEAIEKARSNRYDLIFMDHMMPDIDGIKAANLIRKLGGDNAKVPIIALTANAVSGAKEMFLQNDFNGFLSKPVDIPKMNAVLEKWIPKKKQKPATKKTERSEATPDIVIDGVDVKSGIARTGGDAEIYLRTLAVFCDDGRQKINEIKTHLATGDTQQLVMRFHALKGASANIGAVGFSEAAKSLEMACKQGDMAFVYAHTPNLLANLEYLLRGVGKTVTTAKEAAADNRNTADDNADTIKTALYELNAAIGNLDPDAINAAAGKLRRVGNVPGIGGNIDCILQNTLIGEYDTAVALIESLL